MKRGKTSGPINSIMNGIQKALDDDSVEHITERLNEIHVYDTRQIPPNIVSHIGNPKKPGAKEWDLHRTVNFLQKNYNNNNNNNKSNNNNKKPLAVSLSSSSILLCVLLSVLDGQRCSPDEICGQPQV